jgi:hypothetical protein
MLTGAQRRKIVRDTRDKPALKAWKGDMAIPMVNNTAPQPGKRRKVCRSQRRNSVSPALSASTWAKRSAGSSCGR